MIYLDNNIGNINLGHKQQNASQYLLPKKSAIKDTVYFSSKTDKKNNKDKNKLIACIAGGAVVIAVAIFAIMKYRQGKAPAKSLSDIKETVHSLHNNIESGNIVQTKEHSSSPISCTSDHTINTTSPTSSSFSAQSSSASSNEAELAQISSDLNAKDSEINSLTSQKKALEQQVIQHEQIVAETTNLVSQLEAAKDDLITLKTDNFIKMMAPNDQAMARAAFPKLEEYSERLGIISDDKDTLANFKALNAYIEQITPENINFVLNEGIQTIAENTGLLRSVLKDPENAHNLLSVLNTYNKNYLRSVLSCLPTKESKNNFDLINDLCNTLKLIVPEKQSIVDTILQDPKKYKINKMKDILSYLQEIKPENANFAFNQAFPLIQQNNGKLKLDSGGDIATILGNITPETKDAIQIVADNADKLQLDGLSLSYLISAITPENKKYITVLANNAKKIEIGGFISSDEFKKLLDSGEEGILKQAKEK